MTVALDSRLGLWRWSADTDPWSREQFTNNVDQLIAKVAIFDQGALAAIPAANATTASRSLYLATDTEQAFATDGDEWHEFALLSTPAAQVFLGAVVAPNFSVVTKNQPGTAAPVSGTWVRGDRVWNSAPSASGFSGWVCVTAGTPGTWKTFGAISA